MSRVTDKAALRRAFAWAALRLSAWFALVFYTTDALAALRPARSRVHLDWELLIPYWPPAWLVYFSVLALPFLPLILLPDLAQLRRWELRMAAAVGLAGLCFLVWPVESGYAPADPGGWQALAHLAGWVSGRFNLLPSLHVALSLLTLQAVWPWAGRWQRLALGLWFAALLASVLLTHQHHVADVVAGLLLAVGLSRYIAPPPASRAELISPHAKSSSSKITRYQKD